MMGLLYVLVLVSAACAACALLAPRPGVALPPAVLDRSPARFETFSSMLPAERRAPQAVLWLLSAAGTLVPRWRREGGPSDEALVAGMPLTTKQFRGLGALSVLGCLFVYVTVAREFSRIAPLGLVISGGFGLALPRLWAGSKIQKRKREIVRLLPEVIDLLSVCIGAGLDFLSSLNKIMLIKSYRKEPLIEEFSVVLQDIKLGRRRAEALKALAQRIETPELSSFVRTMVQADRMGTPIADALAVHAEDIRLQRYLRAERAALKAPIKILIPLILFILPCVALIVGSPIFLQFARQNPFGK